MKNLQKKPDNCKIDDFMQERQNEFINKINLSETTKRQFYEQGFIDGIEYSLTQLGHSLKQIQPFPEYNLEGGKKIMNELTRYESRIELTLQRLESRISNLEKTVNKLELEALK